MLTSSIVPVLGAIDFNLMITVTIAGILIVFSMLALLTIIFRLFGFTVDLLSGKVTKKEKSAPAAPAVQTTTPVSATLPVVANDAGQISDELIAVIAAAIAACDPSANYVIRSVKRTSVSSRPAWSAAGVYDNTRPF